MLLYSLARWKLKNHLLTYFGFLFYFGFLVFQVEKHHSGLLLNVKYSFIWLLLHILCKWRHVTVCLKIKNQTKKHYNGQCTVPTKPPLYLNKTFIKKKFKQNSTKPTYVPASPASFTSVANVSGWPCEINANKGSRYPAMCPTLWLLFLLQNIAY